MVVDMFDRVFAVFDVFARIIVSLLFLKIIFCLLIVMLNAWEYVDYRLFRQEPIEYEAVDDESAQLRPGPINYTPTREPTSKGKELLMAIGRMVNLILCLSVFGVLLIPIVMLKNVVIKHYI